MMRQPSSGKTADAYRTICRSVRSLPLMQRFAAAEPEIKLALAMYGFFHAPSLLLSQREVLGGYLHANALQAAQAMIELENIDDLERLRELGWLDAASVDRLLQSAVRMRRTELIVWLLHLKRQTGGFSDRDFSF